MTEPRETEPELLEHDDDDAPDDDPTIAADDDPSPFQKPDDETETDEEGS